MVTFPKIYLGLNILKFFFFKIWAGFCSVSTFSRPGVNFVYVVCWNNEYILENISRI